MDQSQSTLLPTTVRWIPDAEVSVCYGCQLLFDWLRRKHHCRYCGRVFCELCTSQRSLIPKDQILSNPERKYLAVNAHNPHRVCDDCYARLEREQEELLKTMSHAVQETEVKESGPHRIINSPYSFTLQEEIRKATYSVKNFTPQGMVKEYSIPLPLLTHAKGIAFLTVIKIGFVFTGRIGTGLVVARLSDGRWSAPSAIGTAGVGWGPQIGGELTDFVIILNTQRAVDAFCASGQVNLGAELGIAAGPVGRVASGALEASASMDVAPCYSYSHSQGLFAGISLEGSVILSRPDINRLFYGKMVTVPDLLGGVEPPPVAAAPLYETINAVIERPTNGANRIAHTSPFSS
ncbi:putative FYVE zinc finger, ysc84 actin-binding domain, Zinc finger, FYVE/PHD-type [Plasmopara halstedii]